MLKIASLPALCLLVFMLLFATGARADACGGAGQRACNINERIPSCDVNLVEGGGNCVRPNCGAEGQKLCSVLQRTTFNWILMAPLPVPQPCDINLRDVNGVCKQPVDCGREDQRECNVLERIPSCDLNLVAAAGRCKHPPLCGKLDQQPCPVGMRGPALMCDANLVARLGQCVAAGFVDAPGATTGSTGQALSSQTPAGGGKPPPAPTPRPAQPAPALPATSAGAGAMEMDTDRMGNDVYGFALTNADPAACQSACAVNAQCMAWTFVKAGIKGPAAQCYLKNAAPAPTRNGCCVSGAKAKPKSLLGSMR